MPARATTLPARSTTLGFDSGDTGTVITSHIIDYSDPNQIFITDPRGWGGSDRQRRHQAGLLQQPHRQRSHLAGPSAKFRRISNTISFRASASARTSRITTKSLTPDEAFVQFADPTLRQLVLPDNTNMSPVNFGWIGLGDTLAFDPQQLLDAGIYTLVSEQRQPRRRRQSL